MMESKRSGVGSVRLTDAQQTEMEQLGLENESAYIRYKMDGSIPKLQVLKASSGTGARTLPAAREGQNAPVQDQLVIQRLAMENSRLKEQLEGMEAQNQEALSGINHQVHNLLGEELRKRDHEALQQESSRQKKELDTLEASLKEAERETLAKQEEIDALVKKLGLVELGKALLPGAISGLAKQYPKQMQGLAGTLGKLGMSEGTADTLDTTNGNLDEDQQQLFQVAQYLREPFTGPQFEEVVELVATIGQRIGDDHTLIQKIMYYLKKLQQKPSQTGEGT